MSFFPCFAAKKFGTGFVQWCLQIGRLIGPPLTKLNRATVFFRKKPAKCTQELHVTSSVVRCKRKNAAGGFCGVE